MNQAVEVLSILHGITMTPDQGWKFLSIFTQAQLAQHHTEKAQQDQLKYLALSAEALRLRELVSELAPRAGMQIHPGVTEAAKVQAFDTDSDGKSKWLAEQAQALTSGHKTPLCPALAAGDPEFYPTPEPVQQVLADPQVLASAVALFNEEAELGNQPELPDSSIPNGNENVIESDPIISMSGHEYVEVATNPAPEPEPERMPSLDMIDPGKYSYGDNAPQQLEEAPPVIEHIDDDTDFKAIRDAWQIKKNQPDEVIIPGKLIKEYRKGYHSGFWRPGFPYKIAVFPRPNVEDPDAPNYWVHCAERPSQNLFDEHCEHYHSRQCWVRVRVTDGVESFDITKDYTEQAQQVGIARVKEAEDDSWTEDAPYRVRFMDKRINAVNYVYYSYRPGGLALAKYHRAKHFATVESRDEWLSKQGATSAQ
ncbi:TPA: hypothetical protein LU109_003561 [Enterobacter hormaechei subsp. xiangfangensis]|nr:hypothetical protein [Enterobacter hormaechei subsp. xiangfangensis]